GGGLGAAGLDHDNRFVEGDFTRGGKKVARIADGLHINDDTLSAGIVSDVIDQVAEVDIEHGADGDEGAEADLFADAPVEHGSAKRAALADECDVAGAGHHAAECCVQSGDRVHHAEAVGTDDPHAPATGMSKNLPFEFFAG